MRKTLFLSLLMVIAPICANAFYAQPSEDVLSYVAMPLAVSAVCDVRGVQTDRVAQLVTYMDQADVAPADFIDVFRYVPVALVMRADNRPDFVEWVHGQVGRGIVGGALVTSMETQLRTYGNVVPVAVSRPHRRTYDRYRRYEPADYSYAYEQAEYVPVPVRHYCDDVFAEPMSLVDMPMAVDQVYGLGVPVDRVRGLVVELNLGGVPPLQFVEMMRYAPVALVGDPYYGGGTDFVQYVHERRVGGAYGYPLVQVVEQRLRTYDVTPRIDPAPYYVSSYQRANGPAQFVPFSSVLTTPPDPYPSGQYAAPVAIQHYVAPASAGYVPSTVQTRVSRFAARNRQLAFNNAPPPAPVYAPQQVQRLLASQNGGAVVVNPAEARRELAASRYQRQAPVPTMAAQPQRVVPNAAAWNAARVAPQSSFSTRHGRAVQTVQPMMSSAPAPQPHAEVVRPARAHGNPHRAVATQESYGSSVQVGRGHVVSAPGVAPGFTPHAQVTGGQTVWQSRRVVTPQPHVVQAQPAARSGRHGRGEAPQVMPQPQVVQPQPPARGGWHGRAPAPPQAQGAQQQQEQQQHGHGRKH